MKKLIILIKLIKILILIRKLIRILIRIDRPLHQYHPTGSTTVMEMISRSRSPNNPLQAYNVINDLLNRKDKEKANDPNLPQLLRELRSFVVPLLVQQEISEPTKLFTKAFETGYIVGERFADVRVLKNAATKNKFPNITVIDPLIQCTTPVFKDEMLEIRNQNENQVLHIASTAGGTSKTLIVLLPWGGSKRKQYWPVIYHYTNVLKMDVLLLNLPMVASSELRTNLVLHCFVTLKYLLNHRQHTNFVTHAFSMNGSWTFARLILISKLRKDKIMDRCKGIINDSCPVDRPNINKNMDQINICNRRRILLGTSRAYMPGIVGNVSYDNPKLAEIFVAGVYTSVCQHCMEGKQSVLDMFDTTLDNIVLNEFPSNHSNTHYLFLYSISDKLIPFTSVQNAMKQIIKSSGSNKMTVKGHQFRDSPHCMHFRRHQTLYCNILKEFLEELGVISQNASKL